MNSNHENEMWDWQCHEYCFDDKISSEESKHHLSTVKHIENNLFVFDETTPIKACGDLTYHLNDNGKEESEQCNEPSSQAKRRRMLQFETDVLDAPLFDDCAFLRSKETHDSLEDAISDMSKWVAGFAGDTPGSSNGCLDPSSDGWIADYLNDPEMQYNTEDIASAASDVQINVTELFDTPTENDVTAIKNLSVNTRRNGVFRGRKSLMQASPKPSSSVVYPFAFIKPCGALGDVTLKEINRRLHTPPKSKQNEEDDPSASYPTSAFSGKPVVGKTKIRTEGGEGSITIMRTKG